MRRRVRRLEQKLTPSEPTAVTIRRKVVERNPETGNLEVVRVVERVIRTEPPK
jgi:hypothetical protein